MTSAIFYQDPYLQQWETTVIGYSDNYLKLESTIFYPEGGGQPGDSGYLTTADGQRIDIINTIKAKDGSTDIWHEVSSDAPQMATGTAVTICLDWSRRHRHMRMHSCLHLLCSVVPGAVTGGSVGENKSRLDFNIEGELPDKSNLTEQLNALVQQQIPVAIESLSDAELDAQPELVRTMSVQPPRGAGTVRMIRIGNTDYQPCGGTHVSNTSEIGEVVVSSIKNKGKQNKRISVELVNP